MNKDQLQKMSETMGGMLILGTLDGSPSARAGVKYGDILLEVNGVPTPTFQAYVDAKELNTETMTFKVFRGGKTLDLSITFDKGTTFDPISALTELAGKRLIDTDIIPSKPTPSN